MTPEQRKNTAFALCFGIQTLHHVPATTTEKQFDESVSSLTTLWEKFLADARDHHRHQRKNHTPAIDDPS